MSSSNIIKIEKEYNVYVLYNGYSSLSENNTIMKANCTCTLIKGPKNIIIDTMTAWDREKILEGLSKYKLEPDDIDYVISSHGHSDHIGNNNLFLKAKHIVGLSVSEKDTYYLEVFENGKPYKIDDNVEVLPTPGHTFSDVTTIIKSANLGICAVTGDLFECENDVNNPSLWMDAGSEQPQQQRHHRYIISNMVDWIIPGHGAPFRSTESVRNKLKEQFENKG